MNDDVYQKLCKPVQVIMQHKLKQRAMNLEAAIDSKVHFMEQDGGIGAQDTNHAFERDALMIERAELDKAHPELRDNDRPEGFYNHWALVAQQYQFEQAERTQLENFNLMAEGINGIGNSKRDDAEYTPSHDPATTTRVGIPRREAKRNRPGVLD